MTGISMEISRGKLAATLLGAFSLLLIVHSVATYIYVFRGVNYGYTPWSWVYFDLEANIPTLYSITLLGLASVLCFLVPTLGKVAQEGRLGWRIVGVAFAFVALDEYLAIHEALDKILSAAVPTTGVLHYVWIVPYAAICVLMGLFLLPWFWKLKTRLKVFFALSGIL